MPRRWRRSRPRRAGRCRAATRSPTFRCSRAREAVAAIGTLRQARSSMYLSQVFGPRSGWMYDASRSGGGVVANISSHLLFLLDWYFGTPVQVRANGKRLYAAVEDEMQ